MRNGMWKKIVGSGVACSLVLLICAVLVPSAAAVELSPGVPEVNPPVDGITTIVFDDVTVTIRAAEAIPVNFLVFRIYDTETNREVGRVQFSLQGNEVYDIPVGAFTVDSVTDTSNLPYQQKGEYYGYDERTGETVTKYRHGFGYGYGYGYTSPDLVIEYTITFKTCKSGTYYAKLFVKSPKHTFTSEISDSFTVSSTRLGKMTGSNGIKPGCWPNIHSIWNDVVQIDAVSKNKKK